VAWQGVVSLDALRIFQEYKPMRMRGNSQDMATSRIKFNVVVDGFTNNQSQETYANERILTHPPMVMRR
jgi:hypothetical protein